LIHIICCTGKTKLPALKTATKQQKKKPNLKQTPGRAQQSRTASSNQAINLPQHSVQSNDTASPQQQPCYLQASPPPPIMRIPFSRSSDQQTQPTKSSTNDSEMIARLIRENKLLQEKLCAISSKENIAPPVPPAQPGPRSYPEEHIRADWYPRYPEQHGPNFRQGGSCGFAAFGPSLGYPMNAEQSVFPSWPQSAQISHGSIEAIRPEERMSAALYQSQQQLQQFHILYGYPHGCK